MRAPALILVLLLGCATAGAQPARPADVGEEPHHSVVLENEVVRVLAVDLAPQQQTAPYRHNRDFARVILAPAEVSFTYDGMGGPITRVTNADTIHFLAGGFTETARDVSPSKPYRALIVEAKEGLKRFGTIFDRNSWQAAHYDTFGTPVDPAGSYTMTYDTPALHAEEVQLTPGTAITHRSHLPTLVIALTDLALAGWAHDGSDQPLGLKRGEVRWFEDGVTEQVSNDGAGPVRLVILQFK